MTKTLKQAVESCKFCRREINHSSLGHDLRAIREHAGMSMREVARALGFSPSYLCDLEIGRRAWNAVLVRDYLDAVHKQSRVEDEAEQ